MKADRVLLVILDGFGHSEDHEHNAIHKAKMPHWNRFLKEYPHSLLETSGEAVGLPAGIMGNSEVGHLNIGGGRIIPQELTRIALFAQKQGFESLPDVKRVMTNPMGALHFFGLLSDGGVHSDQEHLFLLVESVKRTAPHKKVFIHCFMDGRDTPPQSGLGYVELLQKKIGPSRNVKISTIVGRFYAMDRDKRWERVEEAYKALTSENGFTSFSSATEAVKDAYQKGETDEFIKPRLVEGGARVQPEDSVIFFNFRADRAREISQAFAIGTFSEFKTPVKLKPENWVTFTNYQKDFPFPALFSPQTYKRLLGEEVARRGQKQLRVAETEKYAHVTYFFNGGAEAPFEGEDRVLVPSPKEVATYDLKPEMSAFKVCEEVLKGIAADKYSLVVVNFANGDMVGHSGNEKAAIAAVEALDKCLGEIIPAALSKNFEILVSADHGNCEQMIDPETGQPFTQHTTNPVPLLWVGKMAKGKVLKDGILADIAPTILDILGWEKPAEMTGKSLL